MQESPKCARHLPVHLGDDAARALGRGQAAIDTDAQAEVAVLVGRRHLQERDIERHLAGREQVLDFAEEDGSVVGSSGRHRLAHIGPQEQSVVPEMSLVLRQSVVGPAEAEHVDNFDVAQTGGPGEQRIGQGCGGGASGCTQTRSPERMESTARSGVVIFCEY